VILSRHTPPLLERLFKLTQPVILSVFILLFCLILGVAYEYSAGIKHRAGILFSSVESQAKSFLFSNSTNLDRLDIDIGLEALQRIKRTRQRLINQEIQIGDLTGTDWVKARLRLNGENYSVKLRLKGLGEEHWEPERGWSFRVRVGAEKNIFGARQFQLQRVDGVENIMEWLLMKAFASEGLIAHQVNFVSAYLNGEPWGPYILQNHYDKILIESSHFPEGPIIGFNKDTQFDAERLSKEHQQLWGSDSFWRSPIQLTQAKRATKTMKVLAQRGFFLLEGLRSGSLSTSDVFDVDALGKQIALRAILGAGEFDWRDSKFYVNPVTQKLELISREIHFAPMGGGAWWLINSDARQSDQSDFHGLFFQDELFVERYMHYLERFSHESFLSAFISTIEDEISSLEQNFGFTMDFEIPVARLEDHAAFVRAALQPPVAITAYESDRSTNLLRLQIGVIQNFPVEIDCITNQGLSFACPTQRVVLAGKPLGTPVEYTEVEFKLTGQSESHFFQDIDSATLKHRLLGASQQLSVEINPLSITPDENYEIRPSQQTWQETDLITLDEVNLTATVGPGLWNLDKEIIFPQGYKLIVLPGTTIRLSNGASIISQGPLLWVGKSDKKILIENPSGLGRGILVLSAREKSLLDHVVFRGLANPIRNGFPLRGALTFYQSDVSIANCTFESNIESDDFLNVVRSRVNLSNSQFEMTNADAIDIDFGEAVIDSVSFNEIGNDALDISGTYAIAKNLHITKVGDKGLSIGERSVVELDSSFIEDASVGIAVKDSSRLVATQVKIFSKEIGIALYRKKPEFGPASARFISLNPGDSATSRDKFLVGEKIVEKGSVLIIDAERVPPTNRKKIVERLGLEID